MKASCLDSGDWIAEDLFKDLLYNCFMTVMESVVGVRGAG